MSLASPSEVEARNATTLADFRTSKTLRDVCALLNTLLQTPEDDPLRQPKCFAPSRTAPITPTIITAAAADGPPSASSAATTLGRNRDASDIDDLTDDGSSRLSTPHTPAQLPDEHEHYQHAVKHSPTSLAGRKRKWRALDDHHPEQTSCRHSIKAFKRRRLAQHKHTCAAKEQVRGQHGPDKHQQRPYQSSAISKSEPSGSNMTLSATSKPQREDRSLKSVNTTHEEYRSRFDSGSASRPIPALPRSHYTYVRTTKGEALYAQQETPIVYETIGEEDIVALVDISRLQYG